MVAATTETGPDGAPYGVEPETPSIRLTALEIYPQEVVLDSRGKQQLLVTGVFAGKRQ